MAVKMVSAEFAKKWFNLGRQYQNCGSRRAAIDKAIWDGHQIDCWEKAAAFGAGQQGMKFEIKRWRRYGDIPTDREGWAAPSVNRADNNLEHGVSVATKEWEATWTGLHMRAAGTRKLVRFWGLQVGWGSDGEPVVLPVKGLTPKG